MRGQPARRCGARSAIMGIDALWWETGVHGSHRGPLSNPGGFIMPRVYTRRPPEERFWEKVERTTSCWLWTGKLNPNGYAQFMVVGRYQNVHRFAYELLVGPIPQGLTIDHLCRVRHCVNPAHLEPVTIRENVLRGEGLTASFARKTHCPQGHSYDLLNTHFNSAGGRECRHCHMLRERIRRRKGASCPSK